VLQRAYNHMNAVMLPVEHQDHATRCRVRRAEQLASEHEGVHRLALAEMTYWHAVALVNMGPWTNRWPLFSQRLFHPAAMAYAGRRALPKSGLLRRSKADRTHCGPGEMSRMTWLELLKRCFTCISTQPLIAAGVAIGASAGQSALDQGGGRSRRLKQARKAAKF